MTYYHKAHASADKALAVCQTNMVKHTPIEATLVVPKRFRAGPPASKSCPSTALDVLESASPSSTMTGTKRKHSELEAVLLGPEIKPAPTFINEAHCELQVKRVSFTKQPALSALQSLSKLNASTKAELRQSRLSSTRSMWNNEGYYVNAKGEVDYDKPKGWLPGQPE